MPNYSPNYKQDQTLRTRALRRVGGFTLIELLVVIAIIALLSAALLIALTELQASSKKGRCQQQIKKIDQLIMQRWDEILHKPLPIQLPPLNPNLSIIEQKQQILNRQRYLLRARRELLRLEMPERITDIPDRVTGIGGDTSCPWPATTWAFIRKIEFNKNLQNTWTEENQGAECLYLILSVMQDRDSSALDFFFPSEIGDTDGDGMPEILDGFGQPIGFLRWAPGFSYRGPPNHNPRNQSKYSAIQDANPFDSPDATDMGAADIRLGGTPNNDPYNLFPLIMSAGRDGQFGLIGLRAIGEREEQSDPRFSIINANNLEYGAEDNDPFYSVFTTPDYRLILGSPIDLPQPALVDNRRWSVMLNSILDNISNHQIEVNP